MDLWKDQDNPACTENVKSLQNVEVEHCTEEEEEEEEEEERMLEVRNFISVGIAVSSPSRQKKP